MERLNKTNSINEAVKRLTSMLGQSVDFSYEHPIGKDGHQYQPDLVVKVGDFIFLLEVKSTHQVGMIARAIKLLQGYETIVANTIPVVVVPFMDEVGISRCNEAEVSWLDLSGNADIKAPGLRLYIRGEKNNYKRPGRKWNPFSPKVHV